MPCPTTAWCSATTSSTSALRSSTAPSARPASPILGANVEDSGAYGINKVGLEPMAAAQGVKVNVRDGLEYALPSGDPANPIKVGCPRHHQSPRAQLRAAEQYPGPDLQQPDRQSRRNSRTGARGRNDVVVALDPHRLHRRPEERRGRQERRHQPGGGGRRASTRSSARTATPIPPPALAPTSTCRPSSRGPDDTPVLINQAYRYNNTLGEVVIGMRAKAGGGYEVVSRAGQYLSVTTDHRRRCGHQGHRRSVRLAAADRVQQHGHRQDRRCRSTR